MTCFGATKSKVQLRIGRAAKIGWNWSDRIALTSASEFGDPLNGGTSYKLCLYDRAGDAARLKLGAVIPAGDTCGTATCWKARGTVGWSYKNTGATPDGIVKVVFKSGTAGRLSIKVIGAGSNLTGPLPVSSDKLLESDSGVIVQLFRSDAPSCWSSTFDTLSTKRNNGNQFLASSR